jgi:UDP-N-acetylmuramyl pentapeptide phosphotransferase/UDP-N-acetylglucosamine-1-phosphate transferase
VSNQLFAVSLVIGAAVLALWVDVRFPLRDLTLQRIVGHAIAAVALVHVGSMIIGSSTLGLAVGVFALLLPALVYLCLTALWFVRFTQRSLGSSWS